VSTLVVIAFNGKQLQIRCDASGIDCLSVSYTDHMQVISDMPRKNMPLTERSSDSLYGYTL
jgi:hypothetical protein